MIVLQVKNVFFGIMMMLLAFPLYSGGGGSDPKGSEGESSHNLSYSATREAELMTICLTGKLEVNKDLAARIEEDLRNIRGQFGREIITHPAEGRTPLRLAEISFSTPWMPRMLKVEFEETTFESLLENEYSDWDILNKNNGFYQAIPDEESNTAVILFNTEINPNILLNRYQNLPGINKVEMVDEEGEASKIYPRMEGNTMYYLFDKAWNCEVECSHEYFYFSVEEGKVRYYGFMNSTDKYASPAWWKEAQKNLEVYQGF